MYFNTCNIYLLHASYMVCHMGLTQYSVSATFNKSLFLYLFHVRNIESNENNWKRNSYIFFSLTADFPVYLHR